MCTLNSKIARAFVAAMLAFPPAAVQRCYAADATGNYGYFGPSNNTSCVAFLSRKDETSKAYYASWFAGYLSAYNFWAPHVSSIMPKGEDNFDFARMVYDQCKADVKSDKNALVAQAAATIAERLYERAAPSQEKVNPYAEDYRPLKYLNK